MGIKPLGLGDRVQGGEPMTPSSVTNTPRDARLQREMRQSIIQHPDVRDTIRAVWDSRWALLLLALGVLACSIDTVVGK